MTTKLRIEDFFRYDNWRIPGMWATYETNLFGAAGTGAIVGLANLVIQPGCPHDGVHVRVAVPRGALQPGGLPSSHHQLRRGRHQRAQLSVSGTESEIQHARAAIRFHDALERSPGLPLHGSFISQFSATFDTGETYFPGGTGASVANDFLPRAATAPWSGARLPAACTLNPDGSVTEGSPTHLVPEAGTIPPAHSPPSMRARSRRDSLAGRLSAEAYGRFCIRL